MDKDEDSNKLMNGTGKFKIITNGSFLKILNFVVARENVCINAEINKKFSKIISKMYRKDNSLSSCLKDLKGIIKTQEDFKVITNNHCYNLEKDYLKKFKENYNPYTFHKSVYLLSSFIFKDTQLIDLSKNNIGMDGFILLIPLIKKTINLIQLNLAYNNISDDGSKFMGPALKKNNSIQTLNLECNNIGDLGLSYLSDVISTHRTLKTIKFALNSVTVEGIKHLAALLEKSSTQLHVIDFKYNNLVIRDDFHTEYFRKNKISL